MPYSLSLKDFVLPEFEAPPPESWEKRLREISPKLSNASHLRFRKFAPRDDWKESPFNLQPHRPMWALYAALPIRLVEPLTAEGFRLHWSEQPTMDHSDPSRPMSGEQAAAKALVSDYQHFVWHSEGLYVKPFWLLQGEWGGTPAKFTDREKRYLDGAGQSSIPAPPGAFTPCVFDERAVKAILIRDRLLEAGKRFDELDKMDSPESKKAEDDQAELVYRETVLQTLAELAQPATEYMRSQLGKREVESAVVSGFLRPAPENLPDTLSVWRDHFKTTGQILSATAPTQRKVQVGIA
jgi:hypothetical protein